MESAVVVVVVVLAIVVGLKLMGAMWGLAWTLLVGLGVGMLARRLLPGAQPMSWLATLGYGVAGSVGGGIIAHRVLHLGFLLSFVVEVATAALLIAVVQRKQLPKP